MNPSSDNDRRQGGLSELEGVGRDLRLNIDRGARSTYRFTHPSWQALERVPLELADVFRRETGLARERRPAGGEEPSHDGDQDESDHGGGRRARQAAALEPVDDWVSASPPAGPRR